MSEATRTKFNLVLGTQPDGGIVILDDVFAYSDNFTGATGSVVYPVSQAEIDEATTDDEIAEYHEELWREDAGSTYGTTKSLSEWCEDIDEDEYIEARWESYRDLDDEEIAAAVGVEAPARYSLQSLGRIFPNALEDIQLIDSEEVRAAVEAINAAESKS